MKLFKHMAIALTLSAFVSVAGAAEKLKLATIAPGTSAYLTMTTFSSLINQNQEDYEIVVDATGAATKHGVSLAQGKLDFAMTSPTVYSFLKNGTRMYQKLSNHAELAEKQRLMMWFPYGQYHWLAYADSGIETLEDLKGKKVFFGPPGGGAWAAAVGYLKAVTGLDVKAGDVENVKASWSSALQGFQDRQFDVYVNGGIAPFPQVEQLSLTNEIRILGLTQEQWDANKSIQEYVAVPGREAGVIKADVYNDNVKTDGDVYTHGAVVGIMTRTDMSEDLVYQMTKTFWEHAEKAKATTPWLEHVTVDYAVRDGGMKLHPGAERYYKEIGLDIPAGSASQ